MQSVFLFFFLIKNSLNCRIVTKRGRSTGAPERSTVENWLVKWTQIVHDHLCFTWYIKTHVLYCTCREFNVIKIIGCRYDNFHNVLKRKQKRIFLCAQNFLAASECKSSSSSSAPRSRWPDRDYVSSFATGANVLVAMILWPESDAAKFGCCVQRNT